MNAIVTQTKTNVNGLVTVATNGLELLILPGEDPAAVVASVEAFLAESESKPGYGYPDDGPELGRLWSGEPQAGRDHEFYHGHGCTCPRCEKAHTCEVQIQGVGAGAIAYRIHTPAGKEYQPVVNIRSRVVTCNCANGQKLYRATCYHAQAAWLNYLTDDPRTALQRRAR